MYVCTAIVTECTPNSKPVGMAFVSYYSKKETYKRDKICC